MINSIKKQITYINKYIKIHLIEIDEKSVETIKKLAEKHTNKLEGITIEGKVPLVNDILIYGNVDTLEDKHANQIVPYTEGELDKPVWVTDAVAVGNQWVDDVHKETGMPMMYQSYRTKKKELKRILGSLKSKNILVLKTYN